MRNDLYEQMNRKSNGKKKKNILGKRSAYVRSSFPLTKVRRSRIHGRGVYAARLIRKGARIIEYTGQRVQEKDAPDDKDRSHTFYFALSNGKVIDPVVDGNDARWINHCCEPNCEAIEQRSRIFIYAIRNIEPGEELFYDYSLQIDEPVNQRTKKQFACLCSSSKCRGTMLEV